MTTRDNDKLREHAANLPGNNAELREHLPEHAGHQGEDHTDEHSRRHEVRHIQDDLDETWRFRYEMYY